MAWNENNQYCCDYCGKVLEGNFRDYPHDHRIIGGFYCSDECMQKAIAERDKEMEEGTEA